MQTRQPPSSPASETLPAKAGEAMRTRRFVFCLIPDFSMIAFASSIEPLRLANRCLGREAYAWRLLSGDGEPVRASNGAALAADGAFGEAGAPDVAIVCGGIDIERHGHRDLIAWLRRLASFGTAIGAVCTGPYVLAQAGLLDGHLCTIHWENDPGLRAAFPALTISQELFEIDRGRLTCAGGTAAIDMMLSIITQDHGAALAGSVTDQLIHHRMREADEHQRINVHTRQGAANPRLAGVIQRMQQTVEAPVSCAALARSAGVSVRQLERLFLRSFGVSPTRYYMGLRLDYARRLLRQTSMPVIGVALACGFVSASHFSKSYHAHFGVAPSADRHAATRAPASAPARV